MPDKVRVPEFILIRASGPEITPEKVLPEELLMVRVAEALLSAMAPVLTPLSLIPESCWLYPFRSKIEPLPYTVRVVVMGSELTAPIFRVPALIVVPPE